MPLLPENFKFMQDFTRDTAAIVLEAGKDYLVETRLTPIARQAGFNDLNDFIGQLRTNRTGTLFHEQVIDAMTTNETSFFRDFHPFEALRTDILPRIIQQRSGVKRLNIWSAASSTGQEAYTIAMVLAEHFPQLKDWQISILGTDLSPTVLAHAKQGMYSQLEVNRGLPAAFLLKYFTKVDAKWAVNTDLKKWTEFRQMNLFKPWPILPMFDLVFIRNVMIYFEFETKKSILERIRLCMQPHGVLLLGASETTLNIDPSWQAVAVGRTTIYQPEAATVAAAA